MRLKNKIISIFMCFILCFTTCACDIFEQTQTHESNNGSSSTGGNSGNGNASGNNSGNGNTGNNSGGNAEEIFKNTTLVLSNDYRDYIGDLETFVYGLMINNLEYLYDVFPASVQLSNGLIVYHLR